MSMGRESNIKGRWPVWLFTFVIKYLRVKTQNFFGAYDGYEAGGQSRDFIYVEDLVKTKLWFLDNPNQSGIFNLGTGKAEPFRTIAETVINYYGRGDIEFIEFPEHLKGVYQSFTEADISNLRNTGYKGSFRGLAQGVTDYLTWLDHNG